MIGTCQFCSGLDKDLRPYGPKGAAICFECMKATPEREAAAGREFAAQLNAADVMVQSDVGPIPFDGFKD